MWSTPLALLMIAAALCCLRLDGGAVAEASEGSAAAVFLPRGAAHLEALAAREIQRYLYLRTGRLLPIEEVDDALPPAANGVLVAGRDRRIVREQALDEKSMAIIDALPPEGYVLKTIGRGEGRIVLVTGGDALGTLYGAYRFAEHLGVRFFLHGDVIPDEMIALKLPILDERAEPLFALRGIQPFHDFPEGPDWWSVDDYKAVISQLPKLRMNFIGLHTYPEGRPNAEPTVWIGLPEDVGEEGGVRFSYPSSYQNTLRGNWGYGPKRTSGFAFGAAGLFECDAYGSEVMLNCCPRPQTPEDCNALFDRAADLLRQAFEHAHRRGVRTCVGTETPLVVPELVRQRLAAMEKDPSDPAVIEELYRGIFRRIAAAYPIDYYWLWTPEVWTWSGASSEEVEATVADLRAAVSAAAQVDAPFVLATCGWVLGPPDNRALFDEILPKSMPMSCINRQVGMTPVEEGFADVVGRPKWAIPWLEDDPALTSPQLWVGRMREDARDALRYGCTGLMGIHWRTRNIGPNVATLAHAAWDQTGWTGETVAARHLAGLDGPVDGQTAHFPESAIADTEDDPLYQNVRYNVSTYRLAVPNGRYTVTLKFCEPHYGEAGRRVFGVALQGKTVIESLDIFEKVGQNRAVECGFADVEVDAGRLDIDFLYQVEFPCIAAITIESGAHTRKINCGGPAFMDYEADPSVMGPAPRGRPVQDFYLDWAASQFGSRAAAPIARVFERLDGRLPRPSEWVGGPGGLKPDPRPWEQVAPEYEFVEELAALRPQVHGTGSLDRFDYWVNQFSSMGAMARLRCAWAEFDRQMQELPDEGRSWAARQSALPACRRLVEQVREVYRRLLATVSTPGELGTVANWEQHILPEILGRTGDELVRALGESLPENASPSPHYDGPMRLIVPTVRGDIAADEELTLRVIILAQDPPKSVTLHWRPMGREDFAAVALRHVARGVYSVTLPRAERRTTATEYYIEAIDADGAAVRYPATAPRINQTVIVAPSSSVGD